MPPFSFSVSLSPPLAPFGIHLARPAGERKFLKARQSAKGKKKGAFGLLLRLFRSFLSLAAPPRTHTKVSFSLSPSFPRAFFSLSRRRRELPGEVVHLRAAPLELLAHRLHALLRVQSRGRGGGGGGGGLRGRGRALAVVIAAPVGDGGLFFLLLFVVRAGKRRRREKKELVSFSTRSRRTLKPPLKKTPKKKSKNQDSLTLSSCEICIEQNLGPHIEQKCAVLAGSCGSVASW